MPFTVMHLITRIDAGGSATNTIRSCVGQARSGRVHPVLVYGPSPDADPSEVRVLEEAGVETRLVPHLQRAPCLVKDALAFVEVWRELRRARPTVLHTHCSKAGILGRFAGRLLRTPAIVHTPHGHIFHGYFGRTALWLFTLLERIAAHCCDRIVSLTDLETEEYLARGIGRREQYVTIPSGVPLRRFMEAPPEARSRLRAELGLDENAVVFLSVGRLEPVKGFDILIEAWRLLDIPRPHLVIVGDGSLRQSLQKQAAEAGIGRDVHFLGFRQDVPDWMHMADAFVLASRNEGMGRVFIEAMAAGLPVVATRVGGVPSVVLHERTGLLVPPEDPQALAEAVARLAVDRELRRRMGAAGRERVWPEYDESTMVSRLLELYSVLLAEKQDATR